MTNIKLVALTATMALAIASGSAFAQDDLDDLLKDLDAGGKKSATAAKAETKAEEKTEAKVEDKVEEKAEAKVEEKAEAKVEEKAEAKVEVEEKTEEKKAEEPAAEAKVEEKVEAKPAAGKQVDEVLTLLDELAAESSVKGEAKPVAETKKAEGEVVEAKQQVKVEEKPVPAPKKTVVNSPDAEFVANLSNTEKLRRRALDEQAKREIVAAREAMGGAEYSEAVRHYGLALKFLNDRPQSKNLLRECNQGIAEGLYRAALQEEDLGRRERAVKLMEKALDMRHPKARRTLEKWMTDESEPEKVVSTLEKPRLSEEDYKKDREQIRKHLRRGRQYLALRDMKHALEEVEVVLVNDPYNQEAIRLRRAIQRKRQTILQQERIGAREGMIADVDEAWRPVYAVNAAQLNSGSAETVKTQTGEDPERTMEQDIERRMKEMRLPTISFKPPATIIDAVEFFRQASKDYDRPDIPLEKRGFNFVLRTPQGAIKTQSGAAAEAESDDFSANASNGEEGAQPTNGLEPIQTITASDITFHEALKLVCDSVGYKFIVRGPVVMVMPQDMSTAELLSRKYDVLDAFLERMNAASSDVKEMKSSGFGGGAKKAEEGEENQERDWKEFFSQMGVKWPEGSSIMYIKTLGKLYVRNTRENLAEFEKVLQEMGSQPKLIEIETRFVEVEQQDLNSLGFEWILNSDYSLNLGNALGKALGVNHGTWGSASGKTTTTTYNNSTTYANGDQGASTYDGLNSSYYNGRSQQTSLDGERTGAFNEYKSWANSREGSTSAMNTGTTTESTRTTQLNSNGAGWIQDSSSDTRNIGINAFGGSSDYANGNRYLSTVGNHISGESKSTNDQFMRVNAFLGEADLSMILHMLSQRSDTDLLSAPKVVTKSGENAVIKVVTEYIYPQDYDVQLSQQSSGSSSSSSGGQSSMAIAIVEPQNFTMKEVGVILDVTPTYSEANGGTIDLELKPQVVDEPVWHNYGMKIPITGNVSAMPSLDWITGLGGTAKAAMDEAVSALVAANSSTIAASYVDAGISKMKSNNIEYYDAPMEQPWFHVRSIDSKVSITPGSTVVMGGLITESRKAMDDKVPYLGDLPFIGRLFRSHAEQTTKRNLLIFVTGRLITPSGRELRTNQDEPAAEAEVKAAPSAE